MASALIIHNVQVYEPRPIGVMDILCIKGTIVKISPDRIEANPIRDLGLKVEEIDGQGRYLTPGLIDPHEHIIGGSGEEGFASRSPEIGLNEIVRGGITTVVGCLGVDTFTRNMPALLAQCKVYNEEGITSYIYTGGYNSPPVTLTGEVLTDMILVHEVIGAGEIAISDMRSCKASNREIAKIVSQAYNGGILTGKAGVTHLHMGDANSYFDPVMQMLEEYDLDIESLYPTHVERNEKLLKQAIDATKKGMTVDFDVGEDDFDIHLKTFIKYNGDMSKLTISSDASFVSPCVIYEQMRKVMRVLNLKLEQILPLATTNTARVLNLKPKGHIGIDCDADFNIIDPATLELNYVIAKGEVFMREKSLCHQSKCLVNSNRVIERYGQKKVSGQTDHNRRP